MQSNAKKQLAYIVAFYDQSKTMKCFLTMASAATSSNYGILVHNKTVALLPSITATQLEKSLKTHSTVTSLIMLARISRHELLVIPDHVRL